VRRPAHRNALAGILARTCTETAERASFSNARRRKGNAMLLRSWLAAMSLIVLLTATSTPIPAAALYWTKFQVKTQNEARCMEFAYGAATQQGLQNIRRIPIEVSGTKAGVYVSLTCVGRGGGLPAIAFVIAMGEDHTNVIAIRDQLASQIARMVSFD
jgi:hypothetical protein